jgi:hypothetical protein
MKKKRVVIPFRALPTVRPIRVVLIAAVVWLYADKYQWPGWLIGALGLLFVILVAASLLCIADEVEKDLPGYGEME